MEGMLQRQLTTLALSVAALRAKIESTLPSPQSSQLSDAALRPKARLRAAELRRMMCLGLDDESTLWLAGGEAVRV